jgi:hypothetical protein
MEAKAASANGRAVRSIPSDFAAAIILVIVGE